MDDANESFITLSDLYKAYRKAKADAFQDKAHFNSLPFSNYEQRLDKNLRRLHKRLTSYSDPWSSDSKFIGGFSFIPKSIDRPELKDPRVIHFATLDPIRDWEAQCKQFDGVINASFRQIITPTVDYQVTSALWIMKVGHIYDAAVDKKLSYAHNLRRVGTSGPIAAEAHRLFVPYINGYKGWRSKGLQAMRNALTEGKSIVAVTMDIQQFYHRVSPKFLLRPSLLKSLGILMEADEMRFTEDLVNSINTWYSLTPDFQSRPEGALPVGLTASRVISNVLLAEFDRVASVKLGAIYYGRYADDIFLVVEKPTAVNTGEQFIKWLRKKLEGWLVLQHQDAGSGLRLHLPYAKDSEIVFSSAKQKIFFLSGDHGFDLLDQIVEKIREQSSEYRKLPELPTNESKMAAQALLATPDARLEADALRKAEAVSIRRFGFSILLSDIEAYSRDLAPSEWLGMRHRFYGLVLRYVVTPTGVFDYFSYIVRVFGLMVASGDMKAAVKYLDAFDDVCRVIVRTTSAGKEKRYQFRETRRHYLKGFSQVAQEAATVDGFKFTVGFRRLLSRVQRKRALVGRAAAQSTALALLRADLGRRPYHEYWFKENREEKVQPSLPDDFSVRRVLVLTKQFRDKVKGGLNAPYWPAIAFPTRPIPLSNLCIAAPQLLAEAGGLARILKATRGSRVNPIYEKHAFIQLDEDGCHVIHVPDDRGPVRKIGVPSYLTTNDQWRQAFNGVPDKSFERYVGIRRLINRMLQESPNLRYIAFPECSIPRDWALQIAQKLGQRGISFIAGLENRGVGSHYTNEALVSLSSNYFGQRGSLCFIQPKLALAHHEAAECDDGGKRFDVPSPIVGRPIYVHGGLCIGVLICSDLTTIANRAYLQGRVDALFVLEWNQDISTFEFLVESVAHDLHAAIVQVNNRRYGDSRIRMPFFDSFRRDVVQVKGGDEDFYVVSTLDFAALREFQRDQAINQVFKPLPIGFEMSVYRRTPATYGRW